MSVHLPVPVFCLELIRQEFERAPVCCDTLQAFLDYYYNMFSTNRAGLAGLYQEASMLTFEGNKFQGVQAIITKLTSLPFQNATVQRTSSDFQPSVSGGIVVFVCGNITVGVSHAFKGWLACLCCFAWVLETTSIRAPAPGHVA